MFNIFNNINSNKIKNRYVCFILIFIITITLARLIFLFVNCKQGHHSDEAWSYGFANGYYDPYDYLDVDNYIIGNNNQITKNYEEWVPGSYFKEYITVAKGEQFAYKSVIYNKLNDLSPALYALLLHTVSSFFPDTFSWWFGFGINIFCYIFIEILLFKLSLNISHNKIFSLFIPLYYGLSRAALNTILYVRLYALMTLITLIMVYATQKIVQKEYKKCTLEQVVVILAVFLGGFTHFYALVFDFFLALVFTVYLLIRKEWRHCLTIGGTYLAGAILYIIIYPFGLMTMFDGSDFYTLHLWPYRIELELLINFITRDCFGINYSYDVFDLLDTFVIIGLILIIWALIHFVFRKDTWLKKINAKEKEILKNVLNFTYAKKFYKWLCEHNSLPGILLISCLLTILIIVKFSNVSTMQYYADRYVFFILPLIEFSTLYVLFCVLNRIYLLIDKEKVNKFVLLIPEFIFFLLTVYFTYGSMTGIQVYYFTQSVEKFNLESFLKDKNVIIYDNDAWHLEWYSTEIYEANEIFMVGKDYNDETIDDITSLNSDKEYVIILCKSSGLMSLNVGSMDESTMVSREKESTDYKTQVKLFNEVSDSLDLTPELITELDTFCGSLEIYLMTK